MKFPIDVYTADKRSKLSIVIEADTLEEARRKAEAFGKRYFAGAADARHSAIAKGAGDPDGAPFVWSR